MPKISLFCILITLIQHSELAHIVAVFPGIIKSHLMAFNSLLVELADRGHIVTVFTPFPKCINVTNYHQINTSECSTFPDEPGILSMELLMSISRTTDAALKIFKDVTDGHEQLVQCEPMKKWFHSNENYDILITELFITDALLAYAYQFQKPFIQFSSLPLTPWGSNMVGNPNHPSYIPYTFHLQPFEKPPSFLDRLHNTVLYTKVLYHYYWNWIPRTDEIVRSNFGEKTPSVVEIAKNVSLILTFSHFSFNSPRPLVPAVIDVGGLHIKDPAPLPKDIDEFLNKSPHGVIYFCLGSMLRADTMPPQIRDAFIEAFEQLPQRVLWKWEGDLPGKTKNIMTKPWMPQRDILAHPNVKLFIAHGGALGMNEAIYEGVPMLGIPLGADQFVNLKFIESAGAGEVLLYDHILMDTVLEKIRTVLNIKYAQKAKLLSQIYKDRPSTPMETAIYWIEYVIRHKGARHLQSAAVQLTWYQYYLLDVGFFLLISATVFLLLFITLSRKFVATLSHCLYHNQSKHKKH